MSSMSSFVLPPAFPITGVGILSVVFLDILQVVKQRKAAKVAYPKLYASDTEAAADPAKFKFNCTQRAHANLLEVLPINLALFGYLSLFHPKFATGTITAWAFGRLFYAINYSTGTVAKRNNGLAKIASLAQLVLIGAAVYVTGTEAPKFILLK